MQTYNQMQGPTLVMGKCCKNGGIKLMVPMEQDISFFLDIEYEGHLDGWKVLFVLRENRIPMWKTF